MNSNGIVLCRVANPDIQLLRTVGAFMVFGCASVVEGKSFAHSKYSRY